MNFRPRLPGLGSGRIKSPHEHWDSSLSDLLPCTSTEVQVSPCFDRLVVTSYPPFLILRVATTSTDKKCFFLKSNIAIFAPYIVLDIWDHDCVSYTYLYLETSLISSSKQEDYEFLAILTAKKRDDPDRFPLSRFAVSASGCGQKQSFPSRKSNVFR